MMKLKCGELVYHTRRKQYGIFIKYSDKFEGECYVEFLDFEGYTECLRVTASWLQICEFDWKVGDYIVA